MGESPEFRTHPAGVWAELRHCRRGFKCFKSNTPGACWRRGLDRAEPLFSPIPGRKCKRVPDGSPEKSRCVASAFFNEICPCGQVKQADAYEVRFAYEVCFAHDGQISLHSKATSCLKDTSYRVSDTSFFRPPSPGDFLHPCKLPVAGI